MKSNINEYIKNFIVFLLVFIPPALIFVKFRFIKYREKAFLNYLIGIITILLIVISTRYTQTLIPFILVVICILYLKNFSYNYGMDDEGVNNYSKDYIRYSFSLKKFSIFRGAKYAIFSYFITILIAAISTIVFNYFKFNLKEQEVVNYMMKLPLDLFIIMIPLPVIFAPVLEEFVFRWFLFEKVFYKRIGIYFSAILSSIIFAIAHFNIKAFPIIIWIGLFNCYLIHKKGYWYAVFNHMIFNSVTTLMLALQKFGVIKI